MKSKMMMMMMMMMVALLLKTKKKQKKKEIKSHLEPQSFIQFPELNAPRNEGQCSKNRSKERHILTSLERVR
jgi:hypothetical protein